MDPTDSFIQSLLVLLILNCITSFSSSLNSSHNKRILVKLIPSSSHKGWSFLHSFSLSDYSPLPIFTIILIHFVFLWFSYFAYESILWSLTPSPLSTWDWRLVREHLSSSSCLGFIISAWLLVWWSTQSERDIVKNLATLPFLNWIRYSWIQTCSLGVHLKKSEDRKIITMTPRKNIISLSLHKMAHSFSIQATSDARGERERLHDEWIMNRLRPLRVDKFSWFELD